NVFLDDIENSSTNYQPFNNQKLEIGSIVDLSSIIFGGQGNIEESATVQENSNMDFDP
ncbi:23614_t:CDS:1, partial [Dentiscutata erythropus]